MTNEPEHPRLDYFRGFEAARELAAQEVETCNREGPYEAIGAAKRIREIPTPPFKSGHVTSADLAPVVTVKPLEWQEPSSKNNHIYMAETNFGTYGIHINGGQHQAWLEALREPFEIWLGEVSGSVFDAQTAAQVDYEQRILSAISTRSYANVRREVLEEAMAKVAEEQIKTFAGDEYAEGLADGQSNALAKIRDLIEKEGG